jgi:hypothetical protein
MENFMEKGLWKDHGSERKTKISRDSLLLLNITGWRRSAVDRHIWK